MPGQSAFKHDAASRSEIVGEMNRRCEEAHCRSLALNRGVVLQLQIDCLALRDLG